ncbi:MAG: diguanylate cyclase domain-containing protein [Methylobacter sp.]
MPRLPVLSTGGKVVFIISLFVLISVLLGGMIFWYGNIFDGVRSYVRGEGLWAKAQKDAALYLNNYSYNHSETDYKAYQEALKVISGDNNARLALLQSPPNYEEARKGFLQGQNHPDDIDSMISFFLTFQHISYMRDAIAIWRSADQTIDELKRVSEQIRVEINSSQQNTEKLAKLRERLRHLNDELQKLENRFSLVLSEGARWVKQTTSRITVLALVGFIGIGLWVSRQIIKGITKAEQQLKLAAAVFDASSDGILITDSSTRIVSVNQALCAMTGYSESELLGQPPSILQSGYTSDEEYNRIWEALKNNGKWQGDIIDRMKNGALIPMRVSINLVKNADNQITHYVAILSDISERKAEEEHLRHIAHHDPLTGLANRVLFNDRLAQAIKLATRNNSQFAVLFLDLDKFKPVNDLFGHKTGDKLLQKVADRLIRSVRETDTVTRLGGDEFVLLLDNIADREMVERLLNQIINTLCNTYHIDDYDIEIGVSAGISIYPSDGTDAKTLLHHADISMYEVKKVKGSRS